MIAIWLINRQRPLATVEDHELIEIFRYLNPTIKLLSADTIKSTVMKLYTLGKEELRVSITFIIMRYPFYFTYTYNITDISIYSRVQNLLYIGSLDIP